VNVPRATFDDAWTAVSGVEGWMSEGQGRALFDASAACRPDGHIVEIGSFRGRSTIVLALAAPVGATVIAIDPHAGTDRGPREIDGFEVEAGDDHEVFQANLRAAGVHHRVRHVREFSDRALGIVTGEIDLLYVDGAHRYGPARADIHEWGSRVRPGGSLLIHDSFSSIGVTSAIMRELLVSNRFRYVGRSRSLAIYRAIDEHDEAGLAANALRQLAQLPWFAKNVTTKVLLTIGVGRLYRGLGRDAPEWPY
jgi:predicted O-methyltransferase YrrM